MVIETLTPEDCFSPRGFWKLKKSLSCKESSPSSVVDDSGVEVFSEEAIVHAYMQELKTRLSPRQIDPELLNYQDLTNDLVKNLITFYSNNPSQPEYSLEEIRTAIKSFRGKKGKAPGTDLLPAEILNSGGSWFLENVLGMQNRIKETVSVPVQFDKMSITTLHKKGSHKKLINKRGIFLSSVMSKFTERVAKNRIQPNLEKVNKLQAGSCTNRSPADCHFILRGITDHARYVHKPVYITMYDYRQCFDSLWLQDSLLSLWKLGVRDEMMAIVWKLNEEASIVVKTPHGPTDPFTIYAFVKQGSVLGSNLCSSSTAEFCDEKDGGGINVGGLNVRASLFVDDTTTIDSNAADSTSSHRQVVQFARKKRLTFSHEKCIVLIINQTKKDKIPALSIDDKELKVEKNSKLLGDVINSRGDYSDLIAERVSKAKTSIISAFALCHECTLGVYSVQSLLLIYRTVFLSALLYNSQTWANLTKNNMENLQCVQLRFLKRILEVPLSTPNTMIYLELGVLPIEAEIDVRKLGFLHHILNLDFSDPVSRLFEEQRSLPEEPNWANEISKIMEKYGIEMDVGSIRDMSKDSWKKRIKQAVRGWWFDHLKTESMQKKKCSHVHFEKFSMQSYFNKLSASDARMVFRFRSRMVKCRVNMKSSHKVDWCRVCGGFEETQDHVVNCPAMEFGENIATIEFDDGDKEFDNLDLVSERLELFNKMCERLGV